MMMKKGYGAKPKAGATKSAAKPKSGKAMAMKRKNTAKKK